MKKSIACVLLAAIVSLQCLSSVSCGEKIDTEILEHDKIIKVKLTAYVESLCPSCHAFIKTELFPFFMQYDKFVQLDMIPYGNAEHHKNKDGQWEFTCQHGPPECLGNMYLACATYLLEKDRPRHLMRYYNCLADADGSTIQKDVEKCAPIAQVKFDNVDTCVKKDGPELLAHFGNRTHALKEMKFVPTVVIDDKFDINEQDKIKNDLLGYVCKALKGSKPVECRSHIPTIAEERLDVQKGNITL